MTRKFWTPDRCQKLQDLRAAGMSWDDCATEMRASVGSCQNNLSKHRRRQGRGRAVQLPWNADEDATLINARDVDKLSWARVAELLPRRTIYACISRGEHLNARKRINAGRELPHRADPTTLAKGLAYSAAKERRDITGEIFGDPPPGYSALDRKRAGLVDPAAPIRIKHNQIAPKVTLPGREAARS